MKAAAPGKLVISGAYAVLEGAPAIVSAVNRYVRCDSERAAEVVTAEVRAALPHGPVPHFDASELRADDRKLGLGSSAAILVASLAAVRGAEFADDEALREAIEGPALLAHRQAQGGGSGIDVVASTRGGTLIVRRRSPEALEVRSATLPADLIVEAWASSISASTADLLASVGRFRAQRPLDYEDVMGALSAAARRAADALTGGDARALIAELSSQREGLFRLGQASHVPIVTSEVCRLAAWAEPRDAAVLPSGAGGGDIVLWVSTQPSPPGFRALAVSLGHRHVPLALHARGVSCTSRESSPQRGE